MSAAPDPSHPDAPAPWERVLLDRQLARLDQLADMGLALAGEIQRRATTAAPDADITHAAIDFARTSRAVRMTLALQSRLVRDFKTPVNAACAKGDNDDDDEEVRWKVVWEDEPPTRDQQRFEARRVVRQVGEDCGLDAETVERLDAEAVERLERDDIYADILARPFSEIVADICRDLGLRPDWGRLAQEWWAKEEIKSGKVGSPLRPPSFAAANGGGGVSPVLANDLASMRTADPGFKPGEEPMLEGESHAHHASAWFDSDSS